jgi:alpha 1,2-mannosyltransferase
MERDENIKDFYPTVAQFIKENKQMLQPVSDSMYKGLLTRESRHQTVDERDPIGEYRGEFTNCMIYNNLAIYSLNYLRSKEYTKFFESLDRTGGFFYHK